MEQFTDIVRQINELSGVLLDALEQSAGGKGGEPKKAPGGGGEAPPGGGAPPEGGPAGPPTEQ